MRSHGRPFSSDGGGAAGGGMGGGGGGGGGVGVGLSAGTAEEQWVNVQTINLPVITLNVHGELVGHTNARRRFVYCTAPFSASCRPTPSSPP